MEENQLESILNELLTIPVEDECVEFKEAKQDYSFEKLGQYFSALSNEANLKNKRYSWLVFGVSDKLPRQIVGSNYRISRQNLESLKKEIANQTTGNITFIEIYEVIKENKRVIMFQIPASPKGLPIAWKGHYYGRDGESIGPLNIEELESIRNQANIVDWSAQICNGATIDDLDKEAISKAREQYKI
ncbi:MAG: ATP-binding protein, partial [Clostridiales bacterium]|nr:ATP-binding protein [Clostridiales bacterium]